MKEATEPADTNNTIDINMYPEEVQYAIEYERRLTLLEAQLHSEEDPGQIAMGALMEGCDFYDGDWCGIIEGDLEMGAWCPTIWFDKDTGGMTPTNFHDFEDTAALDRWINALYACQPVIIQNTAECKDATPIERELYKRCNAESILAVPFWKNPVGFLIVRNPKRHMTRASYLQVLAYVAFNSVTEQKMINRSRKAISPDNIKNENDIIINLFGKMEIVTAQGVLTEEELNSPKISRFLVYLLLHRGRAIAPRRICDEIWPDEPCDNPGSKIKGLAFRLQTAFGVLSDRRLVISVQQGYQINPEWNVTTDFDTFDQLWEQAQCALALDTKIALLKNAAKLYHNSLFSTASGEHWLIPNEMQYKIRCLEIYGELMSISFDAQDYEGVRYYAAQAFKIQPASVSAYYWLIRAMRITDSYSMANGELQIAQRVLSADEYAELIIRLEKAENKP